MTETPTPTPAESSDELPMVSGKLVISSMLVVAVSLAVYAWWARYVQSQQVLAVWGKDAVIAIRTGKQVELLRSMNAAGSKEQKVVSIKVPGSPKEVPFATVDISKTPGLIHARHHFIHQKGFDWTAAREEDCAAVWEIGLRFRQQDREATMLFDFACNRVYLVERDIEVTMRPMIADALKLFFEDSRFD